MSMSVHWSLENAHQARVRTWMGHSDVFVLLDMSCRMTNVKVCTEQFFFCPFSSYSQLLPLPSASKHE